MYCGTPSCVLCREGIVFGRFNSVLSYRDEVCIVGPQVVSFVERVSSLGGSIVLRVT
jgi:hypothetical protein